MKGRIGIERTRGGPVSQSSTANTMNDVTLGSYSLFMTYMPI